MKKKLWYFQSKLILIQVFLVLPMLTLTLFVAIYWIRDTAFQAIYESRYNSLQTAAASFDQVYTRMIKLLEKPYTDRQLYDIMTKEYTKTDYVSKNLNDAQTNRLLHNITYYEPDISSVTLVLDKTDSVYFQRREPATGVNVHNPDWYHMTNSQWYQSAMEVDHYLVAPVVSDELYLNSGLTMAFTQRLLNVLQDEKIGVIRIDLGIQQFYPDWNKIVENNKTDIFMILDSYGQIIYCSSEAFLGKYPLLEVIDPEGLSSKYHVTSCTAPASNTQFLYLSQDAFLFRLKQPLLLVGVVLVLCYLLYAVVFIRWSSHYISSPIKKLKTAMVKGQNQDLSSRCEPLAGEMGDLSDAFNQLMERMGCLLEDAAHHEQEKARLNYEILQSKINPHFLYNTLNAIRWKAHMAGAQNISQSLESLASLLKFTIKCTDEIIPFETELQQLEHYIQIMRVRYGDDIEFNFDIDDQCFRYQCLKFLLQPMVENCFIHAFGTKKEKQPVVTIKIVCELTDISVLVEDNGDGMTKEQIARIMSSQPGQAKTKFFGIGLENVLQRIHTLFGDRYYLNIESEWGIYTRVTAVIPKIEILDKEREGGFHDNSDS